MKGTLLITYWKKPHILEQHATVIDYEPNNVNYHASSAAWAIRCFVRENKLKQEQIKESIFIPFPSLCSTPTCY